MEKKLPGYILLTVGILMIAFAAYWFLNGTGDKENLGQVMISMLGGSIALFAGIHFAIPGQQSNTPVPSELPENRNKR